MKQVTNSNKRHSEQGNATGKLLVVAVVIFLVAFAGYNYIPTAYQGANFKQQMGAAVMQAVTLPPTLGTPKKLVTQKVQKAMRTNDIPPDAVLEVKAKGKDISARVYYRIEVPIIPFGIYNYEYIFDYTATPHSFLTE